MWVYLHGWYGACFHIWRTFKMPVPFKTVCCLYTWTFQFGCQMVPFCVNSPFFWDLFWHPDWKVRLYVFQGIFSISLSIYLTFDLSHHPTSLTMINSLDLKGRCPMTSLQKNWKLHRRPHVFFLGGGDSFVGGICFMKMHFLLRTDHSENSCSFPESDLSSIAILFGAIRWSLGVEKLKEILGEGAMRFPGGRRIWRIPLIPQDHLQWINRTASMYVNIPYMDDMGCKMDGCFRMLALCWSKVLLVPTRARYVWHVRVE